MHVHVDRGRIFIHVHASPYGPAVNIGAQTETVSQVKYRENRITFRGLAKAARGAFSDTVTQPMFCSRFSDRVALCKLTGFALQIADRISFGTVSLRPGSEKIGGSNFQLWGV
jgi:hypothetical protein